MIDLAKANFAPFYVSLSTGPRPSLVSLMKSLKLTAIDQKDFQFPFRAELHKSFSPNSTPH